MPKMPYFAARAVRTFGAFFTNTGTVQQKAVKGVVWILLSSWFTKLLFSLQTVILVRFLSPADFGLVGILFMITGALDVFASGGIDSALVQKREIDRKALDTAWILSVARGILKSLFLYLLASPLASFYETPVLETVVKVYSLTYLFAGFRNIGMVIFTREIDFKTITIAEQIRSLITMAVTVTCAYMLRSFWALLAGYMAGELIALVISYWIHPFRPSFGFDLGTARELFRFGRHILLSGIIIHIINRGDDALVGKILGMETLGFYTLAYALATLPSTFITDAIFRITFPTFSRLQAEVATLRRSYMKTLKLVSLLAIPAAAGIAMLGPAIVEIVYGRKWLPMVESLRVLCVFGVVRAIVSIGGGLFQGVGKPHYLTCVSLAQLAVMAVIIYPLTTTYSILGTSIAVVAPMVIVQGWSFKKVAEIIDERVSSILRVLTLPLAGTLVMLSYIALVQYCLPFKSSIIPLLALIVSGAMVYFGAIALLDRRTTREVIGILRYVQAKSEESGSPLSPEG